MKLFFYLIAYLTFISCDSVNYKGYVYDGISKKPISGVMVVDIKNGKKTITDKKGYFQLEKEKYVSSALIFSKKTYYSDTISSIHIQNGEKQKELFDNDNIYLLRKSSRDSIFKIINTQ